MAAPVDSFPALDSRRVTERLLDGIGASRVSVLFVRRDSVYKTLGVDCYDESRNALTFNGSGPVVAHPPCRAWGRLSQFAKPQPHERDLAVFAVRTVRRVGGVVEHPAYSALWGFCGLPLPGQGTDAFGGWTLALDQSWFGHRAPKATWLYCVGCLPRHIPELPYHLGVAPGRVQSMGRAEREATPPSFANWLLKLAGRCRVSRGGHVQ